MNALFVALVLNRNRFLLLRRKHNSFNDAWEFPVVDIAGNDKDESVQRAFKTQIGIDIHPYLRVANYNHIYAGAHVVLFKCSLLTDPAGTSLSSGYSGYLWTYILKVSYLTFTPPHDNIINFLQNDEYVISKKTKGPGSSKSGFASMDSEKRRMIAGMGGKAAHAIGKAHEWTRKDASRAGTLSAKTRKVLKSK